MRSKKSPKFKSSGDPVAQDDLGFWCYCQTNGMRVDLPSPEGAKALGELGFMCPHCEDVYFARDGVIHKAKFDRAK